MLCLVNFIEIPQEGFELRVGIQLQIFSDRIVAFNFACKVSSEFPVKFLTFSFFLSTLEKTLKLRRGSCLFCLLTELNIEI